MTLSRAIQQNIKSTFNREQKSEFLVSLSLLMMLLLLLIELKQKKVPI